MSWIKEQKKIDEIRRLKELTENNDTKSIKKFLIH
jgi:hypothetical protein